MKKQFQIMVMFVLLALVSSIAMAGTPCPITGSSVTTSRIKAEAVSYRINDNQQITLIAERISNNGNEPTGKLILTLWASPSPYAGGEIGGYMLGRGEAGTIGSRGTLQNVNISVPFANPPSGVYYLTMTIAEQTANGNFITDYVTFPNAKNF